MARFVFPLEAVLSQRRLEEERRQRALAELERKRLATEEELRALRDELDREREAHRALLAGGRVALEDVRAQAYAIGRLEGRIRQATLRLSGLIQRVEVARADLLKARRARKGMERLKERRYEAFLLEERRRENAHVDDLVMSRVAYRQEAP